MKKRVFLIILVILLLILPFFVKKTESEPEPEDSPLRPNTEVTYYIDISYDGTDKNGVEATEETLGFLYSDQINIEDTIPEGFVYKGYVEPNNEICPGYLVDGVTYNEEEKKITFAVNELQAGCKISVGITVVSEKAESRIEQYNQAIATYKNDFTASNSIHTHIGEGEEKYKVNYILQGIDSYDKNIMQTKEYAKGQRVTLLTPPTKENITFSSYSSSDVEIENNQFTMPDKDITIILHFENKESHSISFNIEGEKPENYELPLPIVSYDKAIIELNDLKKGDQINGFIFNGWQSEVNIENNKFIMPNKDIILTGSFTKELYRVCYRTSYSEELMDCEQHKEGEQISRKNIEINSQYLLLGYSEEETFLMPKKDVIINVVTTPKPKETDLSITLPEKNTSIYEIGDVAKLGIEIANNGPEIHDVILKIESSIDVGELTLRACKTGTTLCEDVPYEMNGDYIKIETIKENYVLSSNDDFISYQVKEEDMGKNNTVQMELVSFTSEENLTINAEKKIGATEIKTKSPLKLCSQDSNSLYDQAFQVHITNATSDYWIILNGNQCKTIYLPESTYKVEELIPQEYALTSVSGDLEKNKDSLWISQGKSYNITFENTYSKRGYYHSTGKIINKIKE